MEKIHELRVSNDAMNDPGGVTRTDRRRRVSLFQETASP